jgi:uridylate kinase
VARDYIRVARSLGADEATLDELGIRVARLNATLMIAALGEAAYPQVAETLEEAAQYLLSGRIVVAGGLHPGHSTNAVAALIAERVKAEKLINATDVEGVYTADPRQDPSARLLEEIGVEELARLLEGGSIQAGAYELMDPLALKIIRRSRIPTLIVKCSPNTLAEALRGRKVGTRIKV